MKLIPSESSNEEDWALVQLQMPKFLIAGIDALAEQWGVKDRSIIVTRLLQEILLDEASDDERSYGEV